jgi:hypothetical protein
MNTAFRTTIIALLSIVLLGQAHAQTQQAQQAAITPSDNPTPVIKKKVGFRMSNWRTLHADGPQAATELVATLKQIGCEVQESNHGNHTDIGFRCPSWKTVNVRTDADSDQWHQWLVNHEFETVVLNPAAHSKLPTVKVRMASWKTIHAQGVQQAQSLQQTYELIGCETQLDNHGDHFDLKFRCPTWSTVGLANAKAAHIWQDWLNKSGFETQHDHVNDGTDAHAGHDHASPEQAGHNHAAGNHDHDH